MSVARCHGEISRDFFILLSTSYKANSAVHAFLAGSTICERFCGDVSVPERRCKKFVEVMQYKASRRKQSGVVPGFGCNDDADIRTFGTQQICQGLPECMAASACASQDGHIEELVTFLCRDRMVVVSLVNGGCFIQLILDAQVH